MISFASPYTKTTISPTIVYSGEKLTRYLDEHGCTMVIRRELTIGPIRFTRDTPSECRAMPQGSCPRHYPKRPLHWLYHERGNPPNQQARAERDALVAALRAIRLSIPSSNLMEIVQYDQRIAREALTRMGESEVTT